MLEKMDLVCEWRDVTFYIYMNVNQLIKISHDILVSNGLYEMFF